MPRLVIDGSHRFVFAGLLDGGGAWLARSETQGAPLEQLFPAVRSVLDRAAIELEELSGFVYSEGPGSVLGLRLCAMAIETWTRLAPRDGQPLAYNSMRLTAALVLKDHAPDRALLVSDWKKGAWHAVRIEAGRTGPLEVIDDRALRGWEGPLFHLPQRKGWQKPPDNAVPLDYAPERLTEVIHESDLLRPTQGVELYTAASPGFRKWTPERHRAS